MGGWSVLGQVSGDEEALDPTNIGQALIASDGFY